MTQENAYGKMLSKKIEYKIICVVLFLFVFEIFVYVHKHAWIKDWKKNIPIY